MKKLFLLASLFLLAGIAHAQITRTVGAGGDFTTLKLTFDAINAGIITGDITLNIVSDITDDNTATLEASYTPASYTHVLIQPAGSPPSGHWTLTANINSEMIALNGSSGVTINGQIGGSGECNLYLVNNGAGTPKCGKAIRFEYGANHDTISFVHIECNNELDVGAVIFALPAGAGAGNSNNLVDHCDITKTPAGQLVTGISNGNYADNMRNTIAFCNIYDWQFQGINLPSPCGRGWQITGNSFYQTSSFSSHAENYAIRVINGDSIFIQGNKIGGSLSNCEGSSWVNTNTSNSTYAIYAEGDSTMTAYIYGNIIKNLETHGTRFSGIETKGINAFTGSNFIGTGGETGGGIVMTGIGKIYGICAIATSAATHFELTFNSIKNITAFNLLDDEAACGIYIFNPHPGSTVVIAENQVGNLISRGNASGPLVRGILTSCKDADVTITGNQVSDLTSNNGGSFATQVQGIVVSGDLGHATVAKNRIFNLLDNCTGSPSIHGMVFYNRNCEVHAVNNMISLKNGSNLNTVSIYGIYDPGTYGTGTESHIYYYNSVCIGGVSTGSGLTACYKRDVDLRSSLVNNVFYNERIPAGMQNYAVNVNSAESTDFYSDHNDLFTINDTAVGSVNGGTVPLTFALWQSAFSPPHDLASHSVYPNFLTATDLHIEMNAPLNNTGIPILDVVDDIDGNPRDPVHPDPGINEFIYNSYTVGTGGTYATLPVAFDAINTGVITGNIYLEIISNNDDNDTTQAVLGPSGAPGGASYTSVIIRPGGPMPAPPYDYRFIRMNHRNGPMIILSGADNVTIDGYMPGDLTKKRLIFQNSDLADSLGWVFSFTGGAVSNTIKNCLILANCKGYAGAVHFGESFGVPSGNSYNTIENCEITYSHYWITGVGVLTNGITCDTNEHHNNYNVIRNCDIRDFSGSGILIGRPANPGLGWNDWGNDAWEIYGNYIHYTHTLDYYRPSYYNAYYREKNGICIAKGNSHFISSNHISYLSFSAGIKIFGTQHVASGQPVNIYGNVIDHLTGLQHGIYIENQDATVESDTIGSPSLTSNITTDGQVYGIYILNSQNNNTVHIKHNLIANISTTSVWGSGIMMAGIGTNPNGNSLGSGCEISNNMIYKLRLYTGPQCPAPPYGPSSPSVIGIQVRGVNPTVNGNIVHDLYSNGDDDTGVTDSVTGLDIRSTGTSNIFNNMISLEYPPWSIPCRTHYVICGILDASPGGNVNHYYYNSVNLTQSTSVINYSSTFCFYRLGNASNHLRNNILRNNIHLSNPALPNGNHAIGVVNPYLFGSNHNDLYSFDPNRLGSNGSATSNLDFTGWQRSFYMWQDLNSVSIDPVFVSATDLHCTGPEELDNRGTCVPGITADVDGNPRPNPPDLGVNEFSEKIYTTWLGGTDPYWDEPSNWSTGLIPTALENVRLAFSVNSPVIRSAGAACKDLLIDPGVTLTVNPGKYLDIMGIFVLLEYCP